jgi:hypothetical protein
MATSIGITPLLPLSAMFGSNAVSPTAALFDTGILGPVDLLGGPSAIVELSTQGQLFAAVSAFSTDLAQIEPGSTGGGLGSNFGTDFGSLSAEAQSLADAFNALQGSIAGLAGFASLSGTTDSVDAFAQALDNEAAGSFSNGSSPLTNLADIGISLQSTPAGGSVLSIDLAKLNAAFSKDQTGTFGLLTQAINGLNSLAQSFIAQNGGAAGSAAGQATDAALLTELALAGNFGGTGGTDLTSLLLLESLSQGDAATASQAFLAVSQFQLVSSLLGA